MLPRRLIPLLDRVLIRKAVPIAQTAAGVFLPEKSQTIHQGEVVSVGPGSKDYKMTLNVGDKVFLPGIGGQKIRVDSETLYLYREQDIPAKIVD